jgi:hypothetical protein
MCPEASDDLRKKLLNNQPTRGKIPSRFPAKRMTAFFQLLFFAAGARSKFSKRRE